MSGVTQYQTQVTEIKNKWKDYANTLPEEARAKCTNAVNAIAGDLLYNIDVFYNANYGEESLQKTLSQWTYNFDVIADSFCRSKETYVEERGSLRSTMNGIDAALQNTSLKSGSFTKISSNGPSFSERALAIAEETGPTYQFPSHKELITCLRDHYKGEWALDLLPYLEKKGVIEGVVAELAGEEKYPEGIRLSVLLLLDNLGFQPDVAVTSSLFLTKYLEDCATKKTPE